MIPKMILTSEPWRPVITVDMPLETPSKLDPIVVVVVTADGPLFKAACAAEAPMMGPGVGSTVVPVDAPGSASCGGSLRTPLLVLAEAVKLGVTVVDVVAALGVVEVPELGVCVTELLAEEVMESRSLCRCKR